MGLLHTFFGMGTSVPSVPIRHDGPWEKLAEHHPSEGAKVDAPEHQSADPANDEPTDIDGLLVSFQYVDARGEPTKRSVMCRRCWSSNGAIYVCAHCNLRNAYRTFRVDQMQDVIETRTGQPIVNPIGYFGRYAIEKSKFITAARRPAAYSVTDRYTDARRVCIDGVRVIAYIATLRGGKFTEKDEGLEAEYITARLTSCGMGDDQSLIREVLQHSLAIGVPTDAFDVSLKILATDVPHLAMVCGKVADIANEGNSSQAELAAIQKVLDLAHAASAPA
jgi:hypothetical protein